VHNDGAAFCGGQHIVAVHRVAAHPDHAVAQLNLLLTAAAQCAHCPACVA
jgi:hypothetical protein